jgi:hypothetical protein
MNRSPARRLLTAVAYTAPVALFLAIYLPTAGHGFIKDDYAWILASRVGSLREVGHLFHQDNGFYRPVVALTFALNAWLFGTHPLGYGLTNVALALLCGLSIASLARALELPRGAAAFAGALWILNFHGIGMSVLWVSGRTALVLTLSATMSAAALVRGRAGVATLWLLVALFAKEEAVLLPLMLAGWLVVLTSSDADRRAGIRPIVWLGLAIPAEIIYFAARSWTHAMTPGTAPAFYRFSFDIATVARNVAEYADRSATVSVGIGVLAVALLGSLGAPLDRRTRALVSCGGLWLVGGWGLTVWLPVRSDLYACFPSVGACLAAAAVCAWSWSAALPRRRTRTLVAAVLLVIVLSPVYYLRTERWVSLAEFGARTLVELDALTASLPDGARVVIDDDRSPRANMASVFGTLLNEAYTLRTGRQLSLWIEPALADLANVRPPCPSCIDLRLVVAGGHLRPVPPRDRVPEAAVIVTSERRR